MTHFTPAEAGLHKACTALSCYCCRHKRVELRRASYSQGGSITFHGLDALSPAWDDDSRFVGLTLGAPEGGLYIAFNSGHEAVVATLPDWPGRLWQPLIDTGKVCARAVLHPGLLVHMRLPSPCVRTGHEATICGSRALPLPGPWLLLRTDARLWRGRVQVRQSCKAERAA